MSGRARWFLLLFWLSSCAGFAADRWPAEVVEKQTRLYRKLVQLGENYQRAAATAVRMRLDDMEGAGAERARALVYHATIDERLESLEAAVAAGLKPEEPVKTSTRERLAAAPIGEDGRSLTAALGRLTIEELLAIARRLKACRFIMEKGENTHGAKSLAFAMLDALGREGGPGELKSLLDALANGKEQLAIVPLSAGTPPLWVKPPPLPSGPLKSGDARRLLARINPAQLAEICLYIGLRPDFLSDESANGLLDWVADNMDFPEFEAALRAATHP